MVFVGRAMTFVLVVVLACGGAGGNGPDAAFDATFDAADPRDAAFDAPVDAVRDAPLDARLDDAPLDAPPLDAMRDAPLDALDAALDAGACVEVVVGSYVLDGAIPLACPPGAGEGDPEPVVSFDAPCVLRLNPDPVVDDRLSVEGTLAVDAMGRLEGSLRLNGVTFECVGAIADDVLSLDCGDCDVRFRPRR